MKITEFISWCITKSISFSIEADDKLKINASSGVLTPEIVAQLRDRKDEILAWLKQHERNIILPREQALTEFPLSFSQQRLWLVDQLVDDTSHYNMLSALTIKGAFDETVVERVFAEIIQRHEVLRSRFSATDQGAVQIPHDDVQFKVKFVDLTAQSVAACQKVISESINFESCYSFNLERETLLRISLLRQSRESTVLIMNMHHIVSDRRSMAILLSEFVAIYQALTQEQPVLLEPLTIQYADFSSWQMKQIQGEKFQRQLAFWEKQLENLPLLHNLPLDHVRPAIQSFSSKYYNHILDAGFTLKLARLAKEHNVTLFMLLQTAFALLLAKYSNETDIVMAVPNSGRNQPEVESLIGFFVNTLVFRTDLSDNPNFLQLLKQTKENTLNCFDNQDVPFDLLVKTLKPERNTSFDPLCQVKFVHEIIANTNEEICGLDFEEMTGGKDTVRFDLDLSIYENDEGLSLNWNYKTELFETSSIENMARRFENLLEQILSDITVCIDKYSLFNEVESRILLDKLQGDKVEVSGSLNIDSAIREQVLKTPDNIAVIQSDLKLTYQQLDDKVNRLAEQLTELEIGHGDRVAICLERSAAILIAMLATLRVGAVYIPLESTHSEQRTRHIFSDADIEMVLTENSQVAGLPLAGIDLFMMDGWQEDLWLKEFDSPTIKQTIENLDSAYIIYTSGSTGVPKGVEITHAGLIDYCMNGAGHYYKSHLSSSLLATSYSFDISIPCLFVPLLHGDSVEILPQEGLLEILAQRLSCGDDLLIRLTPMHVEGIISYEKDNSLERHVFVIGGDIFPVDLAKNLQERFPNSQIYNHYGPSETVVGCAIYDVTNNIKTLKSVIPIGKAMVNHGVCILDSNKHVLPHGVVGDLYIYGAGVAKGYLNLEALTQEKFVLPPAHFGTSGRIYNTGDRARMLPDGNFEFVGRSDDQVKIRGFRVELGEIENNLRASEWVSTCVVIVRPNKQDSSSLVAYIVAKNKHQTESSELIESLKKKMAQTMPDFMLPAAYVVLDCLPLNVNGKVDKAALPYSDEYLTSDQYVAPETKTEQQLAQIWAALFGLEINEISLNAKFFDIGGHSLMAIRMVTQLRKVFKVEINVAQVLAHTEFKSLAQCLDDQISVNNMKNIECEANILSEGAL